MYALVATATEALLLQTHFRNIVSTMTWKCVCDPTAGPTVWPHAEHRALEEGLCYGIQVAPSATDSSCPVLSFHWGHLVTPVLPKETVITMSPSFSPSLFLYWNTAAIPNVDYTKPKFKGSKRQMLKSMTGLL